MHSYGACLSRRMSCDFQSSNIYIHDINASLWSPSDICHQILDLYSQGNKPIPQQVQEKEKTAAVTPIASPVLPVSNPPPPPPKKTSPQGGSPARQLKRSHVSRNRISLASVFDNILTFMNLFYFRLPLKMNQRLQVKLFLPILVLAHTKRCKNILN